MSTPELAHERIGDWLTALAAPHPEPGGGAAAGLVIATGAALVAMTAGYAEGSAAAGILEAATRARGDALAAAEHDGRMSAALVAAFRSPEDEPGRAAAIIEVTVRAADASAGLVDIASALAAPLAWLETHGAPRVAPDVAVAARLLACGVRAAAVNIRCDTSSAQDAGAGEPVTARLEAALAGALEAAQTLEALADRVTATL